MRREVYDRNGTYLGRATWDEMLRAGWGFQVIRQPVTHYLLFIECHPSDFCV